MTTVGEENLMQKHILIIDDDEKLNELLTEYLSQFNYKISTAIHPQQGLQLLKERNPDLIILDIMLPEMSGFEVCKEIRKEYRIPIIMLTARGEVTDRIVGLELGADDYLPKPFDPRELLARIQSVLRRIHVKSEKRIIDIGDLHIDIERQSVSIKDKIITLTTMEFELLSLFANNPGKVLSRDYLMDHLRGIDWDVFDRSIDVLLSRLRNKLGDHPKNPTWIKTVWGAGYKFIGE
jgi:DNA-binding response OmpR family regulator